jgi:hypothetical protein
LNEELSEKRKESERMDLGKWKILAVSMTLICSLAIPVLAYEYFRTPYYQFSGGIILQSPTTPTMQLGFYWDQACTQPVTIIDFGEMVRPDSPTQLVKDIYIRNEGSIWVEYFWNSTLSDVTTEITEEWNVADIMGGAPLNTTTMDPDTVLPTNYSINLPAFATVGTYNWTLTVWGESWT